MTDAVDPDRATAGGQAIGGSEAPREVNGAETAASARPDPDDALETSRLLLELVHVIYATRAAEAETAVGPRDRMTDAADVQPLHGSGGRRVASSADGPTTHREAPSTHAIRAAVHVHQHGERTIGQLSEGLGISYGWASRVVSELEVEGLVERHADLLDRRVVHVSLTPEAAAMVERTYRWRGEAVQRALDGLSAKQRDGVRTFLRNVTEELARTGREHQA